MESPRNPVRFILPLAWSASARERRYASGEAVLLRARIEGEAGAWDHIRIQGSELWLISNRGFSNERIVRVPLSKAVAIEVAAKAKAVSLRSVDVIFPSRTLKIFCPLDWELLVRASAEWAAVEDQ